VRHNLLARDPDFGATVWRVLTSRRAGSAEETACIADPFCYVAFLSAMERYGLTDRSPTALHLTTPARANWNRMRDKKMMLDFPASDRAHPTLIHLSLGSTLRGRPMVVHQSRDPDAALELAGERTRISTIGRTFADMLAQPTLCGGLHHVLDVWKEHAGAWLDEIVTAVDRSHLKLVKLRAGYILSERMGLAHPQFDAWAHLAQRGGSQKLDPGAPYGGVFSERWMLALNV
jgi:predicted transcriptional regulator of viral defense system